LAVSPIDKLSRKTATSPRQPSGSSQRYSIVFNRPW